MKRTLKLVFHFFLCSLIFGATTASTIQQPEKHEISRLDMVKELPDIEIGSPGAKVKVIEYSALNCTHCARFHQVAFPKIKEKYIDTGKVKFIYRYFPIDTTSIYAMMVVASLPQEKWFNAITTAYAKQNDWLGKDFKVLAQICGVSNDICQKNMQDNKLRDAIIAKRYNAEQRIRIDSTPTFDIYGPSGHELVNYPISDEELEKKISSMLK